MYLCQNKRLTNDFIFFIYEKENKHTVIVLLYIMPVINNNDIDPEIGLRYRVMLCIAVISPLVVVALVYFGLFYTK